MKPYQQDFIAFMLAHDALRFGSFKLKSGRLCPYFFNAGVFSTGEALMQLGQFYANALQTSKLTYDMLFGPAYKGIPLVCSTAIALADQHQCNVPFAFNRAQPKDHGEGGQIVGAPLDGQVLIVDDVITAGTAFRHAMGFVKKSGASIAGLIIALDRQERGEDKLSAIDEIKNTYGVDVTSIIQLDDLVTFLEKKGNMDEELKNIQTYRAQYGA